MRRVRKILLNKVVDWDILSFVFFSSITHRIFKKYSEIELNRLRSGTSLLKDHMHKIMPNVYTSPLCECGMGIQTISHILLDCTLHAIPRDHLFDSIETLFNECNVSVHNRYYNLQVLLGKPEYLQVDVSNRIHHLVAKFLTATGIKI